MFDGRKTPPSDETAIERHPRDEPPDLREAENPHDAVYISGWTGYYMAVGNLAKDEHIKSDVGVDLRTMQ